MSKLNLKYFSGNDGFMDLLDCLEIIKYISISEFPIDPYFVFCEDINLKIYKHLKVPFIEKNFIEYNNKIFNISIFDSDCVSAHSLIKNSIDEGKTVAIHTARNLLPMYIHSDNKSEVTIGGHYTAIIGYESDKYYFVDTIEMLKQDILKKHNDNDNIYVFSESDLTEAFKSLCQIIVIETDISKIVKYTDLEDILLKITQNYFVQDNKNNEYVLGRDALLYFRSLVYSDSFDILKKHVENDFFFSHLTITSRKILRYCLIKYNERVKSDKISINIEEILVKLDNSINSHSNLRSLLFKHSLLENKNIQADLLEYINDIIKSDDSLFELLERIL